MWRSQRALGPIVVLISALFWGPGLAWAQDNQNVYNAVHGSAESGSRTVWGTSYFNLTTADTDLVNRGGASWFIYQYLSLNYRLSQTERVSIRPTFGTETAGVYNDFGDTRPMDTKLGDLHFTYSDYELAHFPGEYDLSGTFYLYLPTSESAQEKKWAARLRSWLILSKTLNRYWTVTYNAKPSYWVNTQKAYRSERTSKSPDGFTRKQVFANNNQMGELEHYFEVSRYFNRVFTPQFAVGMKHAWYTDSNEADSRPALTESYTISPSTWIEVNSSLRFLAGVTNEIDARDGRGRNFELFREDECSYFVMTFWTLQ